MRNGLKVFDADAHHMEPLSMWAAYLPRAYADRGPRNENRDGTNLLTIEGEPLVRRNGFAFPDPHLPQRAQGMLTRVRIARHGSTARLADMDAHGVDAQLIFATVGGQLLGRSFHDPELLAACCRAYNRWSGEQCAVAPERLLWVALLPLQAVDLAIEEARRAAAEGAAGFHVRPVPVSGRPLHDAAYEPLWTVLEDLGLPVCLHEQSSPWLPTFGDRMSTHTSGHLLNHPFEAMAAMVSLIWYGIAERYPRLRFVHFEADAGWLPFWLQRMEQHYEVFGTDEHPEMKKSPKAYFRDSFRVVCRGDEETLPSVVDRVGDDYLLFHTDYPHSDSKWPGILDELESQSIPVESLAKILWHNGARLFPFAAAAPAASPARERRA